MSEEREAPAESTSRSPQKEKGPGRKRSPRGREEGTLTVVLLIAAVLCVGSLILWSVVQFVTSGEWARLQIGGWAILLLGLLISRGVRAGLSIFVLVFAACAAIWAFLWFGESPEFRAGIAALERDDFEGARAKLSAVVEREEKHAEAHLGLCTALRRLGRLEEAREKCLRALKLGTDAPEDAYATLGRIYSGLGEHAQAAKALSAALREGGPNAYTLYERGRAHLALGKADRAAKDFKRVVAMEPKLLDAHLGLGNALLSRGDRKGALREYERFLDRGGSSTPGLEARMQKLRSGGTEP